MLNLTALITLTSLIDLVRFSILFVALDVIRPVCPQPLRQERYGATREPPCELWLGVTSR